MEDVGEIFISSLNKSFGLKRKIGELGTGNGPVLIFIGGIHGNEPSGVAALSDIFSEYSDREFNGKAYAFSGNMKALTEGLRFIKRDLNRLWLEDQVRDIENGSLNGTSDPDETEQIALFNEINKILTNEEGPFMFFDLHTTSASSPPFILINDTLLNRKLAEEYPHRIILGIEEYLDGPLLSYINDQGYISLGFEAGQHDDPISYEIHKKFVLQSFLLTGFLKDDALHQKLVKNEQKSHYAHTFFEVRHCYQVTDAEEFRMDAGYMNFSPVKKGQAIAKNKYGALQVKEKGNLFMPLYQRKGNEGFYLIKLIPTFWLQFSSFIRKINFDSILLALPGIRRYDDKYKSLEVNERIAKYLARDILHLLGYRRVQRMGEKRVYIKREFSNNKLLTINSR